MLKDKNYIKLLNSRDCLNFLSQINSLDGNDKYKVELLDLIEIGDDEISVEFQVVCKMLKNGILSRGKASFKCFSCDIESSSSYGTQRTVECHTKDYARFMHKLVWDKRMEGICNFIPRQYYEDYNNHWEKVKEEEIKRIEEEYADRIIEMPNRFKYTELADN